MSAIVRFEVVMRRSLMSSLIKGEAREQVQALLSPENVRLLVKLFVAGVAANALGVGLVFDAGVLLWASFTLGQQAAVVLREFASFVTTTYEARTDSELDEASRHFARFIVLGGVVVLSFLLLRKGAKATEARIVGADLAANLGGIVRSHFEVFRDVAQKFESRGTVGRYILVRIVNPKATPWIERGFPVKGSDLAIKTSKTTGLVTITEEAEIRSFSKAPGNDLKYVVIEKEWVSNGQLNDVGRTKLGLNAAPDWPVEPGQVIELASRKPITSDYDLQAIVNSGNRRSGNMFLAASDGELVKSMTNPWDEAVVDELNGRFRRKLIQHGANEHGSFEDGGVVVFKPDGTTEFLATQVEVEQFYMQEFEGRQMNTQVGKLLKELKKKGGAR